MGFETHIKTDYGDEIQRVAPWELYDEEEAKRHWVMPRKVFILPVK